MSCPQYGYDNGNVPDKETCRSYSEREANTKPNEVLRSVKPWVNSGSLLVRR